MTSIPAAADLPGAPLPTPQGVELRHLRYFVAVADAGTFTHAAERMFIAQATLSQQIRRLEEIVGTPLLQRGRVGVRVTDAGSVLLEESRAVLSLVDHGVNRTRQAAAAGVEVAWIEAPLDGEFSAVRQHRADAGLGWLTAEGDDVLAPLEAMSLGEFEPDAWLPRTHPAASDRVIGLGQLAELDVIHGPRRLGAVPYDRWLSVLRASHPGFGFTDPPFRRSLPMTLAFAAGAGRPTAVLTGPHRRIAERPEPAQSEPAQSEPAQSEPAGGPAGLVRARIEGAPLAATAALVWSGDLPRQLQQVLFDTADGIAC